jgi:hypothetical protein
MSMRPFEKYIKQLGADKELQSIYRKLRNCFKREGWSEEDLVKPPYYPQDIMRHYQAFSGEQSRLFNEVRMYFDIDHNEFIDYLKKEMKQIDDETPLNVPND